MSTFEVKVTKIEVEPHPGADRLELCKVGDYRSVVTKDQYKTGDLVAYIPEASELPLWLQKELGVDGKLAGPKHNRVKAIRLRGILSQGLVYPAREYWKEGDEVSEELQITKYEPPVPAALAGEVFAGGSNITIHYDIENYKKVPTLLRDGDEVVFTEKLHGTFACFACLPDHLQTTESGHLAVTSKGLGAKGLCLKDNERNATNTYMRVAKSTNILEKVRKAFDLEKVGPVFVLGEIFGSGIQDLTYDANASSDKTVGFRIFDIFVGIPNKGGYYLDDSTLDDVCNILGINRVPILYRGPFSKELLVKHTTGKETVSGKARHIREGIVVRPRLERFCAGLPSNRLQLKSVSEDYLTRKDGTEYN